jgi:hypothetical protein
MPWTKTAAYKEGIIDENGIKIKSPETKTEKEAYNMFHKLVFNIRRLLQKIPIIGKSTLTNYASALYLIKEHTKMSDKKIIKCLKESKLVPENIDELLNELNESTNNWYLVEGTDLIKDGIYTLMNDSISDEYIRKGSAIQIYEHAPVGEIFGLPIYEAYHFKTKKKILVSHSDILPAK